ncbi:hypothetical protein [Dyadobacter psychrotolerans]|uniref:Uncharacterized protein n=1 Tax=Dyadobacter psychrotolerans TaxID=2541721 RepID=A0A4R5DHI7_9BACT|nr:hypothetical protein [Dyadobacter psychrotolerans]TDE10215.1 hypothetical protein E0F88_28385 [Dyadobacter psychrotolerans]
MRELNYIIISTEMVWQWYYDPCKGKHFKELLGKEARFFISILETKKDIYIEDILPQLKSPENN